MEKQHIVVTFKANEPIRQILQGMLGEFADIAYLLDLPEEQRIAMFSKADVVFTLNPRREILSEAYQFFEHVQLFQLQTAGVDHVPFDQIPEGLTIASNVGGYAEPIAEHVLALTLALARNLRINHDRLKQGDFHQGEQIRTLRGAICGILGFGGIGQATARLMRAFGAKIYAINSRGQSSEPTDFIGTLKDLESFLRSSDVVVISLPLKRQTWGLIGRRELAWMKEDAILINVARGEIIDEGAFYHHLKEHPNFLAGIESWWIEPFRHGEFRINYPFLDLPNVLGSPHNSFMVPGVFREAVRRAAENIGRFLRHEPITGLVRREDYT